MSRLEDKVNFNKVRYANCWEDADVLLSSLKLGSGSNILCVASAGDNALALLSTDPGQVWAVDLSGPQLHVTALKIACFKVLNHEEMLRFLGVKDTSAGERLSLFEKLSAVLSKETKEYWQPKKNELANGIIYHGKFEHYFGLFRKYLLPLVHSKRTTDQLLKPKEAIAQSSFYRDQWNTWRWRLLMNFFFSKRIMGKYGRDPEFLKQVQIDVPAYIRNKAEQHLQSSVATRNYFLHFIFKGVFGNGLPFYLRPENFESIRRNIDRIGTVKADVNKLMSQQRFDAYCLSNIFEYFPETQFVTTVSEWSGLIAKGSKLAYWNLMAPRSFSAAKPDTFKALPVNAGEDKGFFYSKFLVEERY